MPLRFKMNAPTFKFDEKKFTDAFKKRAEVQVRQGMRAFLRAILEKNLPPELTGEARGSLIPLGRFLRVAVPARPRKGQKNRVARGTAQGIKPIVKSTKTGFSIRFGTRVEHYVRHDAKGGTGNFQTPRPWNSFKIGTEAFNNYILANLDKFKPALKEFVKVTQKEIT